MFFISIHALVKRATAMVSASPRIRINFNPRPREEGDAAGVALYGTKWISIHALVKRATSISTSIFPFCVISIHALVKRATQLLRQNSTCLFYFNPRPREEGDERHMVFVVLRRNFNPRPREEGDYYFSNTLYRIILFQSTPS